MRIIKHGVLALLSGIMLFALMPSVGSAAFDPTLLTSVYSSGALPKTDGDWVIWDQQQDGYWYGPRDIYGFRLSDRQVIPIATTSDNEGGYAVDDGVVAWTVTPVDPVACDAAACSDVLARDLTTGEQFAIAATSEYEALEALDEGWAIYSVGAWPDRRLVARNISSMSPPIDLLRVDGFASQIIIDSGRIYWKQDVGYGSQLRSLAIGETQPNTLLTTRYDESFFFDVAGDTLVYATYATQYPEPFAFLPRIAVVDVLTSQETTLAYDRSIARPWIDGDQILWATSSDGLVFMLDIFDRQDGTITSIPAGGVFPDVANGVITWQRSVGGPAQEVHAAHIADLLASDFWRYFDVTRQYVRYGFRDFWERNGGLPVFGYPLTSDYQDVVSDTLTYNDVQYFERQRFEWHPEHEGTPYEVQLGRLGANIAEQMGLLDSAPFLPAARPPRTNSNCTYVDATQHQICGKFLEFWRQFGIDLGVPGISFAESLALFGYPISDEYVDAETGLTIQYFERAVFELHPEHAGTAYEVLLRRLGASPLSSRAGDGRLSP